MLRTHVRSLSLALGLAATILAGSSASVAASMPDGAYARFGVSIDGDIALIILSYTGSTTVNAGVTGLVADTEYFVRGSSQGCGNMPSATNAVFNVTKTSNADGVLWLRRSPQIPARVNSIWLGTSDGGEPPVCGISFNFERMDVNVVGDWNGDGLLGIWDKEHVLSLLERKPNNKARLTVVTAFWGTETFTYSLVDRTCGHYPTRTFFSHRIFNAKEGGSQTFTLPMTPNQMGKIRSARAMSDGAHECANTFGILIA